MKEKFSGEKVSMPDQSTIQELLQSIQNGYTRRNLDHLDAFMELFTPQAEIIGTNGVRPGIDE